MVSTLAEALFAKVKLDGRGVVLTVVLAFAQLLVLQPLPGVGAVPPVVVATDA